MLAIKRFLSSDHVKPLAKATQIHYQAALSALDQFLTTKHDVHALAQESVELMPFYAEYLVKEKGLTEATVSQYITIAKLLFRHNGLKFNYIFRKSSFGKKQKQRKSINRWFSEEEIKKCLAYNFPGPGQTDKKRLRNKIMIRLLIETGARIREVADIEWTHIDTNNRIIHLKDSKTQMRPIFYSEETGMLIDEYRRMFPVKLMFKSEFPLFPGIDSCKKTVCQMLEDLKIKKPKDGRGPHTFRHYAATCLYFVRGMNLNDLAFMLGDKPETIRNHYLHPTPEMMQMKVKDAYGWN
jgi:integrase